MLKKLFESSYFNMALAVLAAILIIMQEFFLGTPMVFLSQFALGVCASAGFSWGAEVLKMVFGKDVKYSWKNVLIGTIAGIFVALILAILV